MMRFQQKLTGSLGLKALAIIVGLSLFVAASTYMLGTRIYRITSVSEYVRAEVLPSNARENQDAVLVEGLKKFVERLGNVGTPALREKVIAEFVLSRRRISADDTRIRDAEQALRESVALSDEGFSLGEEIDEQLAKAAKISAKLEGDLKSIGSDTQDEILDLVYEQIEVEDADEREDLSGDIEKLLKRTIAASALISRISNSIAAAVQISEAKTETELSEFEEKLKLEYEIAVRIVMQMPTTGDYEYLRPYVEDFAINSAGDIRRKQLLLAREALEKANEATKLLTLVSNDLSVGAAAGILAAFGKIELEAKNLSQTGMGAVAVLTVGLVLSFLLILRSVVRPLTLSARTLDRIRKGDLNYELAPTKRRDEIGQIHNAVALFKDTLKAQKQITEQEILEAAERKRLDAEREAARKEEERKQSAKQTEELMQTAARQAQKELDDLVRQEFSAIVSSAAEGDFSGRIETGQFKGGLKDAATSVNQLMSQVESSTGELSSILMAMADGNLTSRMNGEYSGVFENIRTTMNSTISILADIVMQIDESSDTIGIATREIASSASSLRERTEHSAATLEETAAAVKQLAAAVSLTSDAASEANSAVADIKANAEIGNSVVDHTVAAMSQIETSSSEISKVISLIDDIAFQTNLLALNAGVEAARAGEAGRGFAVVAKEVRDLAERSATAAKEISGFIEESSQQVKKGVELVDQTRTALKLISVGVSGIADQIEGITISASEQSASVAEINSATVLLGQTTQKNAAMFDEATASSQILKAETDNLANAISAFKTGKREDWERGSNVVGFGETRMG